VWDLWKEALVKVLGASTMDKLWVEQLVQHCITVPTWLHWFYDPSCYCLYERIVGNGIFGFVLRAHATFITNSFVMNHSSLILSHLQHKLFGVIIG
jgi:hypothetical protein